MKVVLAHGCWDLLHVGHLAHLEQAAKMGYLVVSVVPDKYATKRKPIYGEKARVRLLRSLRCVDQVELCDGPGPEKLIRKIEPDIYVRGSDYRGKTMPESALLKRLGIKVRYTKSVPPRTSDVIEKIRGQFNVYFEPLYVDLSKAENRKMIMARASKAWST